MEILIGWLGFSIVVWIFAKSRGRSGFGWFCIALLISPLLAGLLVLVMRNRAVFQTRGYPAYTPADDGMRAIRIDPPAMRR